VLSYAVDLISAAVIVRALLLSKLHNVPVTCHCRHTASACVLALATDTSIHIVLLYNMQAVAVHGDKSQSDRERALAAFKTKTTPLMIATDVAARGLDIPDVEYVINYSYPLETSGYIHRIGRTGRAGKTGVSYTFFHQGDKARAGELVNVLSEAGQVVPEALLKFGTHVKKKEHKLYGAFGPKEGEVVKKATKITFDDSD
jgi:ATP-dependent RNA helicase DBP3